MDNIRLFLWATLLASAGSSIRPGTPSSRRRSSRPRRRSANQPPVAAQRHRVVTVSRPSDDADAGDHRNDRAGSAAGSTRSRSNRRARRRASPCTAAISCASICRPIPSTRTGPSPSSGCSTTSPTRAGYSSRGPQHRRRRRARIMSRCFARELELSAQPGEDELVVTLDWVGDGALSAQKIYTFQSRPYEVDLTLTAATAGGSGAARRTCRWSASLSRPSARSYFSRRLVFVLRARALRRQRIQEAQVRRSRQDARSRRRRRAVGSRRFSITFSRPPCRRPTTAFATTAAARGGDVRSERARHPDGRSTSAMPLELSRSRCSSARSCRTSYRASATKLERTVDYGTMHQPLAPTAVLAPVGVRRLRRQLGLVDHHRDIPDQARVLSAHRDERPLDGEDAQARAAHEGASRALQRRSPGA